MKTINGIFIFRDAGQRRVSSVGAYTKNTKNGENE